MNIETRTRRRDAVSKISSGVTALSRPFNLPLFPLFIEARARACTVVAPRPKDGREIDHDSSPSYGRVVRSIVRQCSAKRRNRIRRSATGEIPLIPRFV